MLNDYKGRGHSVGSWINLLQRDRIVGNIGIIIIITITVGEYTISHVGNNTLVYFNHF